MFQPATITTLAAILSVGLFVGCSSEEKSNKPASQVAAKVNKGEISVHQVNEVLASMGSVLPEQVKQASAAALERLIDQELLVQQAGERQLEREPKVMRALENARREVLARAYAEQVTSFGERPTAAQISAFYVENPALFSKRRVYSLQELNIRVPGERVDEVQRQVMAAGSIERVAEWLGQQSIPFAASAGTKPAEQMPIELVRRLLDMKAGQLAVTRTPMGLQVFQVVASREEPVDEAKAKPFIEQYLFNQARTELAKAEMKRLRQIAKIDYVGDFKPPSQVVAVSESAGPSSGPAANAPTDQVRSAIEKGAASLK